MSPTELVTADEVLGYARASSRASESMVTVLDLSSVTAGCSSELATLIASGALGVTIGWAPVGLNPVDLTVLEQLTTTISPHDIGRLGVVRGPDCLDRLVARVRESPAAAAHLDLLLRTTVDLPVPQALAFEAQTYGLLLASREHVTWLEEHPRCGPAADADAPVLVERSADDLSVVLNRPERRNAFGRQMRDALVDALELPLLDPSISRVVISGAGPCFSAGGDLDEFGTLDDPASATLVRLARSVGRQIHALGHRAEVTLHGACVGAGIEVPAFASRVVARQGTWFMLPEVAMGLVPGAGGTVSVTRRIGRWRAAYMMLSGERITLDEALEWGLVDDVPG